MWGDASLNFLLRKMKFAMDEILFIRKQLLRAPQITERETYYPYDISFDVIPCNSFLNVYGIVAITCFETRYLPLPFHDWMWYMACREEGYQILKAVGVMMRHGNRL